MQPSQKVWCPARGRIAFKDSLGTIVRPPRRKQPLDFPLIINGFSVGGD